MKLDRQIVGRASLPTLARRWAGRPARQSGPAPPSLLFVALGSGRAASLGVGNKGALLDRAARAGLPVPRGMVVLDAAWQRATRDGLIRVEAGCVRVPDPARLVSELGLPRFLSPLAVRSAFSAEDDAAASLAGFFSSRLWVAPDDPLRLADALADVWTSAARHGGSFRRDVLIMGMVHAEHAGVAFTEREFEDDLVNLTTGTADRLVSGDVAGTPLLLAKLRFWERPSGHATDGAHVARLQALLRDVRQTFGAVDWDVEWADDGRRCWLVQVRPITRPTRRNEAFTVANHREILPDLPSRFMTSLIRSCAGGLFGYYRRFDRRLPEHRPFIEVFCGRPFINLSLLTEMLRIWGLPTKLVTDSIGGAADREHGSNLGRLVRNGPILVRLGLAQLGSVGAARRTIRGMHRLGARPGRTIGENIEMLRDLYTLLVTGMRGLTSAIGPPLALLRRLGVLQEHAARQRTIATELFTDLEPLRAMAAERPDVRTSLAHGVVPTDPAFCQAWERYLSKHGHRGIYESDIARPRFREAPESLLAMIAQPPGVPSRLPPGSWLGLLTLPIWWQAGRAMRARESLRYTAMLGFDQIRQALLTRASDAVRSGALPNRDALWLLEIDEAHQLDRGWSPGTAFFTERTREIEDLAGRTLPDLLHRFDDLDAETSAASPAEDGQAPRRLTGVSLTDGDVRGRAWVLTEPSTDLPPGFTPHETILVARSVDAGWIPTFSRVAGVVVEIGGDLSHGSIILREIGLPSVTNTRHATALIRTGETLALRAGAGVVERLV